MTIPSEIKCLYFIECGFYFHSVYATIYMDTKRKDFYVMLIHHFLTMALMIVSYATKYHKIGILVIFVHDATDIILEFTKCNVYLKNRNKKFHLLNEYISNAGFLCFAIAWFIFRIYWFPIKILYSTSVVSIYTAVDRGAGLYGFFNILLWFLFSLDLYWFQVILLN
jgi:sphingoid base N-stearoyltransferase